MKSSWWILLGLFSGFGIAADSEGVRGRLSLELIEVERSDWSRWQSAPENSLHGSELREHVRQLQKEMKASLVETTILALTPSSKSTPKSVAEITFPSEFGGGAKLGDAPGKTTHFSPSAFETQETGFVITAEFDGASESEVHSLQLTAEVVTRMDFAL